MNKNNNQGARDRLIDEYRDFVHGIAGRLTRALHLPIELFDECVAAGYLGLVEAAERFDFESGVEFRNYAYLRIRGAIIDSVRANSPLSVQAYRLVKAAEAVQELRNGENAPPEDAPQSARLANILDFAGKAALTHRLSLQESAQEIERLSDPSLGPEGLLEQKQEKKRFHELIESLPEREREIIRKYYFEGKTFEEIAKESGRGSKSWICRLHARAIERMKEHCLEND